MTDLRTAAQQALEALEDHAKQYPHMQKGYTVDAITALRAALAQQAEPQLTTSMDEITRLRAERDALAERLREVRALLADTTERVMNAWAEQRLARHGIPMPEAPTCPDCHGIGYDASGQTCACQENPSF